MQLIFPKYEVMDGSRPLLTPKEVADQLRMTVGALAQMRYLGTGPRFLKLGNRVLYRRSDLDDWLNRCVRSRTDAGSPKGARS